MTRLAALVLALGLVGAGCSGDADTTGPSTGPSTGPTAGPTAGSPAPPDQALPEGVSLTEPGTRLGHGQPATVSWRPGADAVAVVDLQVDRVRQAPRRAFAGWQQDEAMSRSRPYFVEVLVENRGESDLGGLPLPLFLLDDHGTYGTPWTFEGDFEACPSGPLPRRFAPGEEAQLCLVYLAADHGTIEAMAFAPDAGAEPITWRGEVTGPGQPGRR